MNGLRNVKLQNDNLTTCSMTLKCYRFHTNSLNILSHLNS